jgi:hypothetical protein
VHRATQQGRRALSFSRPTGIKEKTHERALSS